MKNLLFTLIALVSGIVSAQSFKFEKYPPIRIATSSGATLTFISQDDLSNDFMIVYKAQKDGFDYILSYDVKNDTIRGPLVIGPVQFLQSVMKTSTQNSTKTLSELTIDKELVDDFIKVLEEAQAFKDTNGGFERLFDGHLRVATNGDSPMVTIFDTLDKTLISVPKDVVVYRMFHLFKS